MLASTLLAIPFVSVFYVALRGLVEKPERATTAEPVNSEPVSR